MSFNEVIKDAASRIPTGRIATAKARVSGGIRLLNTESELNDYLVAFGEIHRAKLMEFLPHLPYGELAEKGVVVIDWGCGQGLATAVLMDYLLDRHPEVVVRRFGLVEIVPAALKRAEVIVRQYEGTANTPIEVWAWNVANIERVFADLPDGVPVLHLFSNILDVRSLDIVSVRRAVERLRAGRKNYVVSCGPDMETKNSRPMQLLEFLKSFDHLELIHVFPTGGSGRLYGNWKYWPYGYCKCYGFAYALAPIQVAASSRVSAQAPVEEAVPIALPMPKPDPEDIVMYASEGMLDELDGVIEAGTPVDFITDKGATALYFAAKHGHAGCVRRLLEAKANTEMSVRTTGMTPYLIAVKYDRLDVMRMLSDAGCDVRARDVRGRGAAEIVSAYGLSDEVAAAVEQDLRRG